MRLDESQQFVIASSLLERPDGLWVAKEVGVEEPRQNGKGEMLEARGLLGLFLLDERMLVHSAHEFATASEALDRMDDRIAQNPQLKRLCKPTKRSHGEEGIYCLDGCKLRYRTRTKRGGRGFTADWLALDEAMFIAEAFHGSLMPTVSAVPNPQIWYTGSAVDKELMDDGVVFSRLRRRALRGDDERLAFFGWEALLTLEEAMLPENATNPEFWAQANSALNIRIDPEHVALEQRSMSPRTFAVERMGVGDWPTDEDEEEVDPVIDLDLWDERADGASAPLDPVWLSFDMTPTRSAGAIGAAGRRPDGLSHVEVVDHRQGTGWMVDRIVELDGRHGVAGWKCDDRGPAGSLIPTLKDRGVEVEIVSANEHAKGCGLLVDAVTNGTVRHLGQRDAHASALRAALKGAVKRPLGDAWAWSRSKSAVDISPLVTVTLALFGFESSSPEPSRTARVY